MTSKHTSKESKHYNDCPAMDGFGCRCGGVGKENTTPMPWQVDELPEHVVMVKELANNNTWIAIEDVSDTGGHVAYCHPDYAFLLTDARNSYAKHCKDPIAAAESDLLGQALTALEVHHNWCRNHQYGYSEHGSDAVAYRVCRAILAQRK